MATVAPLVPANNTTIQYGGGGASKVSTATTLKRKTPSELRGELLKRKNVIELVDESPSPVTASTMNSDGVVPACKKDLPKNPRYIDIRMDELFPVRKNSIRLRLQSKEEISKNAPLKHAGRLNASSVPSHLGAESQPQIVCKGDSVTSVAFSEDRTTKTCNTAEKCSESTFHSVAELSLGAENLSGLSNLDTNKALKGLVANDSLTASASLAESSERTCKFKTESSFLDFIIPGKKTPLDLTLKTAMRVVSSASVNWFHRSVSCGTFYNRFQYGSWASISQGPDMTCSLELTSGNPGCCVGKLCSWVFPQSPLPPSVISALTSAAAGGQVDFFSNRQQAWEDSFRSLYYMLRKNMCHIFYVCTVHFVVMFTACDGSKKRTCNAYISRSTRGLRSLLKEHDVSFSMPFCPSKVDEVTTEDLVELLELEKFNLNQVRCKEVRRADQMHLPLKDSNGAGEPTPCSSPGICYSVEIKDAYIPTWVVSSICNSLGSNGSSFEASFMTEPTSIGLNIGLDINLGESDPQATADEALQKSNNYFGIQDTTFSPHLRSAFLKGLKYSSGSYTASFSRV